MKTRFLFPNRFKIIGWILLIPSAILGIASIFLDFEISFLDIKVLPIYNSGFIFSDQTDGFFKLIEDNITNEIAGIFLIIGCILIAFSKEKDEDEFISKIRLESLVWATYVNYLLLLIAFIFLYAFDFLYVMIFNMFTLLLFFIIRFNFYIYKLRRRMVYEE